MQKFVITGGRPLSGTVRIAGAKNGVLKMMAAAALTDQPVTLRNVPKISDVTTLREVMTDIGFEVKRTNGDGLEIRAIEATWPFVPLEAAARMRASFILLGPMLARFGRVILPNPGGDRIGRRPVDYHVTAMEALGATIEYRNGYYYASAPPSGLAGAHIEFPIVSVMGTENALLAATLARGTTVIDNAAVEPEVDDLIAMLQGMGAQHRADRRAAARDRGRCVADRRGASGPRRSPGGGDLRDRRRRDPRDRDAAGHRSRAPRRVPRRLRPDGDLLRRPMPTPLHIRPSDGPLRAIDVRTDPYPGFATDFQAPFSVLMTQADGVSHIHETIFEDRLDYARELTRMGAEIDLLDERHARITGPTQLHAAEVEIADLRAGATLILAALTATGTSVIDGVEHVDRGYEQIEAKLVALGAQINRIEA